MSILYFLYHSKDNDSTYISLQDINTKAMNVRKIERLTFKKLQPVGSPEMFVKIS